MPWRRFPSRSREPKRRVKKVPLVRWYATCSRGYRAVLLSYRTYGVWNVRHEYALTHEYAVRHHGKWRTAYCTYGTA